MFQLNILSTQGKREVLVAHIGISFQEDTQVNTASSRHSFSLTQNSMKQESYLLFILITTVLSAVVLWVSQLCCTIMILCIVKGSVWVTSCTVELKLH